MPDALYWYVSSFELSSLELSVPSACSFRKLVQMTHYIPYKGCFCFLQILLFFGKKIGKLLENSFFLVYKWLMSLFFGSIHQIKILISQNWKNKKTLLLIVNLLPLFCAKNISPNTIGWTSVGLVQCFFSNFVMLPHWRSSTRKFSHIWL